MAAREVFTEVCGSALLSVVLLGCALPSPRTPLPEGADTFDATTDRSDLGPIIDRIQRECLRAYPPELLAAMAPDAPVIPAKVDADPQSQFEYLEKDVDLAKGAFYPSTLEDLVPVMRRHIKPGIHFLDLGSGDGRVVFLASHLGAHATGIEYDAQLVSLSRTILTRLEDLVDPSRTELIGGDFFEHSWSGYDVIYYYNNGSFEEKRMMDKLLQEMDPGSLLILYYDDGGTFENLALEYREGNVLVFREALDP